MPTVLLPGFQLAKKGEAHEGIPVVQWSRGKETHPIFGYDERTFYNWRQCGLPAKRDEKGAWWYPWPHIVAWTMFRAFLSAGNKTSLGFTPIKVAMAWWRFQDACSEVGLDLDGRGEAVSAPPAPQRGRFSYRAEEAG